MDNMTYWKQLEKPPKSALRQIQAGRLKGMTDINPQWRIESMTKVFGPIGIGWKYTIEKMWTEPGAHDELICFVQVSVYVKHDQEWSDAIPGLGGNKLVAKESRGLHTSDEGYKMALTDALSVALKALGVAANVYAGLWDGSRHNIRPENSITRDQLDGLKMKLYQSNKPKMESMDRSEKEAFYREWCLSTLGEMMDYTDPGEWTREQLDTCIQSLNESVPFE
tara:strand:- start:267 stop:935 length:669 start_codon:yes stop_codon:yes gene_type:complete